MTQETTTVAVKGPADNGAVLALEKIKALHLQGQRTANFAEKSR